MTTQTDISGNDWPYNPNFQDFATFLGLPVERDFKGTKWNHDQKTAKKIEEIYEYAITKSGELDHNKAKKNIYELIKKIGVNWTGELLVNKIWQHIQFDSTYKSKVKEMVEKAKVKEDKNKDYLVFEKSKELLFKPEKGIPSETKEVKFKKSKVETFDSNIHITHKRSPKVEPNYI